MYELHKPVSVLLFAFATTACGAAQMSGSRSKEVEYALHAAEKAGAANHPPSARLLDSARRERMKAQHLADNGDVENAALMLDRSEADAELAVQLIRTAEEREEARDAWAEHLAPQQNRR